MYKRSRAAVAQCLERSPADPEYNRDQNCGRALSSKLACRPDGHVLKSQSIGENGGGGGGG